MSAGAAWIVRRLEVTDLRPWTRVALDLPTGLVLLAGPNGAGKTSLLEAVTLACLGVSPRTSKESEVVRAGAPALRVGIDLEGPGGLRRREIGYAPGIGRRLWIDGEAVRSLGAWRAAGALLVFLPEELRAVKGPPAARRRHLDRLLEAAVPGYADDLAGYGTAMSQRNALLRRVRAGVTGESGLAPWEAAMAEHGARVARARRGAIAVLTQPFGYWLRGLGGNDGGTLRLEASPSSLGAVPDDDLEEALARTFAERRETEIRAAQTLGGPHRDDVWIGTAGEGGEVDLRRLGSQGEQRTAVLALLLAHREHLARRGARPVLLLDDVLSELDPRRRGLLLEAIGEEGQAIVTSADPEAAATTAARAACVVQVRGGRLAA